MQSIRNRPKTILALTGLALSIGYRRQKAEEKRLEDAKKKKVLVLPFHRMKIVEERSPTSTILTEFASSRGGSSGGGDDSKTIEMPVDEVVTLIHEAAQDPGIAGLYGVFGHGGSITGGWAHLEEIRTALLVFASSHRQHKEPAINGSTCDKSTTPTPSSSKGQHNKESTTDSTTKPTENGSQYRKRKFMYVYADTFASPTSSMKDFYVASVFSKIHLQENGDLNLFGLHATNTFFKDFLQKYGINVHVWKHGEYKNAGKCVVVWFVLWCDAYCIY
jgi:Peptidase family S49